MDRRYLNVEIHNKRSSRRNGRRSGRSKHRGFIPVIAVLILLCVAGAGTYGVYRLKKQNGNQPKKDDTTKVIKNSEETTPQESGSEEQSTQETTAAEPETTSGQEEETVLGNIPSGEGTIAIDPDKPMVALTFDDGPSSKNTGKILDALKENGGHATFFTVGYNLSGNEALLKRAVAEGNEIGSHTLSHSTLTTLEDAALDEEIDGMKQKIKDITGQSTVVIRPPYGAVDERVLAHIKDPVILWSVDTEDWKTRDTQMTIKNVQDHVFDGAIILMHDIHAESMEAALQIIPWLKSQGYQMVTISELGYYRRGGLRLGVKYGSIEP